MEFTFASISPGFGTAWKAGVDFPGLITALSLMFMEIY